MGKQLFNLALKHYQTKELPEAEAICRKILSESPADADTLHLAGLIAHNRGELDMAVNYFQRALALNGSDPHLHHNLGNVYRSKGDLDSALKYFKQAVDLKPDFAEAHYSLGGGLHFQGKLDEAASCYEKALHLNSRHSRACFNLGNICSTQAKADEAIEYYRQVLNLAPDYADVYINLGSTLQSQNRHSEAIDCYNQALKLNPNFYQAYYNLGNIFQDLERFEDAVTSYEKALRIKPDHTKALYSLGNALYAIERKSEAILRYEQALQLIPDYSEALINLGTALYDESRFDDAINCYKRLLQFKPDYGEAYNNLGIAHQAQGKFEEALLFYDKALKLKPDHPESRWNVSLISLINGDYEKGWREFRWRFKVLKEFKKRTFLKPEWDGSSLEGKRILVITEQGFGDIIQFIRYLPYVKSKGGYIILECQEEMFSLFNKVEYIDEIVERTLDSPPVVDHDCYIHLMSLPDLFQTRVETIQNMDFKSQLLDSSMVEIWKKLFDGDKGFKIGIAWAGNPKNPSSRYRSCDLSYFSALSQIEGVTLYSLQKGQAALQAFNPPDGVSVVNLALDIQNFSDSAAIISNLDLIVSVDTVVAHLAGTLIKPTWVLLPYVADWRWLLNRNDSPWYPSVRLFRQRQPGEWQPIFSDMALILSSLMRQGDNKIGNDPDELFKLASS